MSDLNLIGTTVGKFQILAELGRGGMGVVYLARQRDPDRRVALKVLLPELLQDRSYRQRLRQEADNAARLEHPGILPIYEVGELQVAGQPMPIPYIAMRYIEGRTLRDVLADSGPMSPAQALNILSQVGAALDYAHQHQVIHRDLKPSNILIGTNGWAYLTDFGLARDVQAGTSGLTMAGTILGTPEYMSPEQAQGSANLTSSSDIYALGIILYEMLTGKLPFSGESPMSIAVARLLHPPVPPRDIRGDLPTPVEDVVMRALARRPEVRYSSAAELVSALQTAAGIAGTQGPATIKMVATGGTAAATGQALTASGGSTVPPPASPPTPSGGQLSGGTPPPTTVPPLGNQQTGGSQAPPPQQPRRGLWPLAVIGALLALLFCGGGAFFLWSQQNDSTAGGDQSATTVARQTSEAANATTIAVIPTATAAPAVDPTVAAATAAANTAATAAAGATATAAAAPSATAAPPAAAPPIRLSQATLIDIFRGEITSWNDARLQADNPGLALPDLPITVVYRSDASGTTRTLTEYLTEVSPWWRDNIGAAYRLGDAGSSPWPVGEGASGSSNLAAFVKTTPGAIGYAAPSFALQEGLPLATVQNSAGNWVTPSTSTLGEAATNTVDKLDARLRGFIVNAEGPNAYPLTLYTWIIACPAGLSLEEAQALTDFLYWATNDPRAIAMARELGYEAPPLAVRRLAVAELEAIRIGAEQAFTAPPEGTAFKPRSFAAPVAINGAGATLPDPLYQELLTLYRQVEPGVTLSYNAQGSTRGRTDLLQDGTVQFAGTEEAVVDDDVQITRAVCRPAPLHMPMAVGAVGIMYNLPVGP